MYQRPISVLKSGSGPSSGVGPPNAPSSGPHAQPGACAAPSLRLGPGGPAPGSGVRPSVAPVGGSSSTVRPSVQQAGGPTVRPMGLSGGPLVTSVRPVAGSIRPLNSAASAPGGGMGALSGRQAPGPHQSYMGKKFRDWRGKSSIHATEIVSCFTTFTGVLQNHTFPFFYLGFLILQILL